jgi:DnaJ-class molecular chaperone
MGRGAPGGFGSGPGFAGGGFGGPRRGDGAPAKPEAITRPLQCTLEELFTGCTKKVKITRARLQGDGRSVRPEEKVLEIVVRPGWKRGTTVTFEGEGDEAPGMPAPDVKFLIGEKAHERFEREGSDLVLHARLSLAEALCGTTMEVRTLDGRVLSVAVTEAFCRLFDDGLMCVSRRDFVVRFF